MTAGKAYVPGRGDGSGGTLTAARTIALLGGPLEPTRPTEHRLGPWHFAAAGGGIRSIRAHGVEVVRGIDFLSRDSNWGVHALAIVCDEVERGGGRLVLRHAARSVDGAPALRLEAAIVVEPEEMRFTVTAVADEPVDTARTGFVVLHPLEGFTGSTVRAGLGAGPERSVRIPERVSPAQPLREFDRLAFDVAGVGTVELGFEADAPFEMEDQRNWTDASFKTYYRPLSMPWPYRIEAGTRVVQAIRLRIAAGSGGTPAAVARRADHQALAAVPAPQAGLVWLAADPAPTAPEFLAQLRPHRLDAHVDLRGAGAVARAGDAAALARELSSALRLSLILPDEGDVGPALASVAEAAGDPASVLALPAAFLKSYQPDGEWPQGRSCAEALAAVRRAFPRTEAAEGMLTFFTELNRHPPDAGADAVSFGTAAIVHAADDISVMETLEALPSVFATARAHAGDRPVDVSLGAIGLWTNPYGKALAANPSWGRTPLSDRDPRLRGLYGAAWLAGYFAHATAAGIRTVGLGAVSGPLGLLPDPGDGDWLAAMPGARLRPVWHVGRALARLGTRLEVCAPARRGAPVVMIGAGRALVANTSPEPTTVVVEGRRIFAARVLDDAAVPDALADPDWLDGPATAADGTLVLPPYAVALATLEQT